MYDVRYWMYDLHPVEIPDTKLNTGLDRMIQYIIHHKSQIIKK